MSLFPRLLKLQRKGRLAIVGNGLNKVDFTSVQNLNEALMSSLLNTGSHWAGLTTSVTARQFRFGMWSIM